MLASTDILLAPYAKEWLASSGLDLHIDAYAQGLVDRGYRPLSVRQYLSAVAHFAHWCEKRRMALSAIDEHSVKTFVEWHLPRCECASRCMRLPQTVRAALRHLLDELRTGGYIPALRSSVPAHIDRELRNFDDYLRRERGLTKLTRHCYLRFIPDFLNAVLGEKPIQLRTISTADITLFMQRYTAAWKPVSIKSVNTALRSYFAFKTMQGEPMAHLAAALPRAAIWRQAQLPKMASADDIERLLRAYDRTTATGKRDYAIARCLIDLGLRRVEVARLTLEDVDWREGLLRITAKGRRIDVLPLPDVTGEAIADYLRRGRPPTSRRELFVRHRPPHNAPADIDLVRSAIRFAAVRAGLQDRIRGTHILRHTMAGRLVQSGTPLKQIADLLRHRDIDTTTIYAKVNFPALTRVAMPWPGRSA